MKKGLETKWMFGIDVDESISLRHSLWTQLLTTEKVLKQSKNQIMPIKTLSRLHGPSSHKHARTETEQKRPHAWVDNQYCQFVLFCMFTQDLLYQYVREYRCISCQGVWKKLRLRFVGFYENGAHLSKCYTFVMWTSTISWDRKSKCVLSMGNHMISIQRSVIFFLYNPQDKCHHYCPKMPKKYILEYKGNIPSLVKQNIWRASSGGGCL